MQRVAGLEHEAGAAVLIDRVVQQQRLERSLEVGCGLLVRKGLDRCGTGSLAVADCAVDVAECGRLREVPRQLLEPGLDVALPFELVADLSVQAETPARRELVVERRAHERMGEPVDAGTSVDRLDQPATLCGAHRVEDAVGTAINCRQRAQVELATDHCCDRERLVGRGIEVGEATADHLPHPLRNPDVAELEVRRPTAVSVDDRAGLGQMPKDLTDEERVALGFTRDGSRQGDAALVELVAGGVGEELLHSRRIEPAQHQPLDARLATQVGQDLGERMCSIEVGVPIRRHDQDVHRGWRAQEVTEQEQGRLARPVQVVEHEQHRCTRSEVAEQLGHRLEQAMALRLRVVAQPWLQPGDAQREVGDEREQLASPVAKEVAQHLGRQHLHQFIDAHAADR